MAESPDGRLAFVMIPPITLQEEEGQGNTSIEHSREIRRRFQRSGLYSTGADRKCLWEASVYLHDPGYVSNDGRHVVTLGAFTWSSVAFADQAIMHCVEDGYVVNTVTYGDVAPGWFLKRLIVGDGPQCEEYGLDKEVVWITTNFWEKIEFDFNTGKVVRISDPLGKTISGSIIAAFLAVAAAVVRLYTRGKNKSA